MHINSVLSDEKHNSRVSNFRWKLLPKEPQNKMFFLFPSQTGISFTQETKQYQKFPLDNVTCFKPWSYKPDSHEESHGIIVGTGTVSLIHAPALNSCKWDPPHPTPSILLDGTFSEGYTVLTAIDAFRVLQSNPAAFEVKGKIPIAFNHSGSSPECDQIFP